MRILVCGGRHYSNRRHVYHALDAIKRSQYIECIIVGGASGADAFGQLWAMENKIYYRRFDADWKRQGKAAGYIRNRQMLIAGKPDLVLAFPGGSGTADMVAQAKKAEVEVVELAEPKNN